MLKLYRHDHIIITLKISDYRGCPTSVSYIVLIVKVGLLSGRDSFFCVIDVKLM